jgi:hypothetical protein
VLLLLGASAMPVGLAAYALAGTSSEPYAVAVGVWGTFVIAVAVVAPIVMTLAGILALFLGHDE